MNFKTNTSFKSKIFIALLFISVLFITLVSLVSFYQSKETIRKDIAKKQYAKNELIVKIFNHLSEYNQNNKNFSQSYTSYVQDIFFDISDIFDCKINIYNSEGKLLLSNYQHQGGLSPKLLNDVQQKKEFCNIQQNDKSIEYDFYSIIQWNDEPYAIINTKNNASHRSFLIMENAEFRFTLLVFVFLTLLSGLVAWIISKNLTRKINLISKTIENTDVASTDSLPLVYNSNDEISPLIEAYNKMRLKIRKQTYLIQKNEREEAWKEMARQVAHEINNPLTPLRLTIQNFQRKFNPLDSNNKEKIDLLTQSIIHQIDIISSIAKSFSDYAKMPANQNMKINVVEVIKKTISIFPPSVVTFHKEVEHLYYRMDMLYLSRIITNIVKNGIQSTPDGQSPRVNILLKELENYFIISIQDNGIGIPKELQEKIFEPNFTTKTNGMGLGLYMVKNIVEDYHGKIWLESQENVGTTFYISFNKEISTDV